ncbi:MAG TPA: TetR family transcriptional regulator [Acidimicrobiales bacterium]|nr:TetR family transcriptional regulator [Acidimicrobiales bacterium]
METARHGKGERTRQAILGGAIRRFAVDGYRATSVAEIARDAGVTPAAAYAYFASKEDLFTAAVDADAAGLIEAALGPALEGSFDVDWAGLIGALLARLSEHPLARRVLAGLEPEHSRRLLDIPALTELRKVIAERLQARQETGEVRSDIDPTLVAAGLETTVMALLIGALQVGIPADGERTPGVTALFDAALRAPVAQAVPAEVSGARRRG